MKHKKIFEKKNIFYDKQEGYTIVEILLVTFVIGLTFSVSLPLFGAVINKARQKEATLIVNSVLKAVKASYALDSFLPSKIKSLEKFASFQKCISEEVAIKGREVCDLNTIATIDIDTIIGTPATGTKNSSRPITSMFTTTITKTINKVPAILNV